MRIVPVPGAHRRSEQAPPFHLNKSIESEKRMKRKSNGINMDLIAGILLTAIAALLLIASFTYPKLNRDDLIVGADLFPKVVAAGMLVCALVILIKAIVKPVYRPPFTKEEKKEYLRTAIVIALCVLYTLVMPKLGFILTSILTLAAVQWVFGNRNILALILVSILFPVILFAAFKYGLGVQLPAGILSF